MSSKPTPGPWFADDEGEVYRLIGDDRDFLFSTTGHQDDLANGTLAAEAGTVHHETGLTPQQLRERMERAEKQRDELLTALKAIVAIEAVPFDFPADWDAQIAGCSECQRYKDHPIQKGICDNHRKPLYARKRHEDDQQATLIYRAKDAARAAIASVEAAS